MVKLQNLKVFCWKSWPFWVTRRIKEVVPQIDPLTQVRNAGWVNTLFSAHSFAPATKRGSDFLFPDRKRNLSDVDRPKLRIL